MLRTIPMTLLVTLLLHWTLASPVDIAMDHAQEEDAQAASLSMEELKDDDVAEEADGESLMDVAFSLCLEQESEADCLEKMMGKRNSILRFGRSDEEKRANLKKAVLRWGKRASVIRWGKKAQPLRWGKRQMPTFRFG